MNEGIKNRLKELYCLIAYKTELTNRERKCRLLTLVSKKIVSVDRNSFIAIFFVWETEEVHK